MSFVSMRYMLLLLLLGLLGPLQIILRPKNQFALFFLSSFTAKLLHLGSHAGSLPILLYLLYFPTFLLPDVLLLVLSKVLLYRLNGGTFPSTIGRLIGAFLALFTAGCSAAQISFSIETGGEIQWMAAGRVLAGRGGLGLLLSGLPAVIFTFAALYTVAWVTAPKFYDAVEHVLDSIARAFAHIRHKLNKDASKKEEAEGFLESPGSREKWCFNSDAALTTSQAIAVLSTLLIITSLTLFLQLVRPKHPPYAHMSGSLPLTLIEAALFQPVNSEFCLASPVDRVAFPWEQFMEYYEQSAHIDWMAHSSNCSRAHRHLHGHHQPLQDRHNFSNPHDEHHPPPYPWNAHAWRGQDGLRAEPPPRHHRHGAFKSGYDPVCDPLKLSNLDADFPDLLVEGPRAGTLRIKNILLLTLESTRKDVFPLKKDSHAYNTILSSYTSPNLSKELDEQLGNLTSVATFLSGEPNGFGIKEGPLTPDSWRHAFRDGMGGINVQGAVSEAAFTLKSLLSSHCGVEPLPVDFTEEAKLDIYQSCLAQILDRMALEALWATDEGRTEDYRTWPWSSSLVQSVTDKFDSQDILDEHMGFSSVISQDVLDDPTSKHFPPKQERVGYFGYPEPETLEYLRDMFKAQTSRRTRLFVSHLTSSPHHPHKTPKDWPGHKNYISKQRWRPEDPLAEYLNSIKYQDDWLNSIFQMLHNVGALNETLIIMTGDHGLAFDSLDKSKSTVDNGHIANFAIPLLFVHPDLPRVQLKASTTPLSIIPTVLDLLLQTESLPKSAAETARTFLPRYQGQSLVRQLNYSLPTTDGGVAEAFFKPWHFSVINPGGSLLAISDASSTFRLVFPLCSSIPLRFTDISTDPTEADPAIAWTMDELAKIVESRHGVKAKEWAKLAQELGRWWFWDQHQKWGYWGNARATGRAGAEIAGAGRVRGKKWWET